MNEKDYYDLVRKSEIDYYDLIHITYKDGMRMHIPAPFFKDDGPMENYILALPFANEIRDDSYYKCPNKECDFESHYVIKECPECVYEKSAKREHKKKTRKGIFLSRIKSGKNIPQTIRHVEYVKSWEI